MKTTHGFKVVEIFDKANKSESQPGVGGVESYECGAPANDRSPPCECNGVMAACDGSVPGVLRISSTPILSMRELRKQERPCEDLLKVKRVSAKANVRRGGFGLAKSVC